MRVELTWMRNMDYPLYTDEVELVHEKRITPFGNSAKVDAPKKYRGWRSEITYRYIAS